MAPNKRNDGGTISAYVELGVGGEAALHLVVLLGPFSKEGLSQHKLVQIPLIGTTVRSYGRRGL